MRKLRILALLCALLMVLSGCSLIAVIPGNTQTEEIAVPKPEESTASAVPEESTPDAEPSAVPEEDIVDRINAETMKKAVYLFLGFAGLTNIF